MSSIRQDKVSRMIQKVLGEVFTKEIQIPGFKGMISVTGVRMSPDLSFAKVYLSIFPTDDVKAVFEVIQKDASTIRGVLGKKIGKDVRVIPELAFYIDDSLDYAANIDNLLKK